MSVKMNRTMVGLKVNDLFRTDIRKMDIRVISDKKAAYNGPVYIDNLRAM